MTIDQKFDSNRINIAGTFDVYYPQEGDKKDPEGSEKTKKRISELGLNSLIQIKSTSEAFGDLQKLTLQASKELKEPIFFSDPNAVLKAVNFLELFCFCAVQSKAIQVQPNSMSKSYIKATCSSTALKAIKELELIKQHIEIGIDKKSSRIIAKTLNKHIDKIFTHCLSVVEQNVFVKGIKEAKGILKKI